MMKAVCFLMVLTAFGCALGQRKEVTLYPMRIVSHVHEVPPCPEECQCTALVENPQNSLQKAICGRIPVSLDQNIRSLQVLGTHSNVTAEQILKIGRGLNMLDLTDCDITAIEDGAFNSLIDLVILKLSENYIWKIGNKTFSSPRLEVLCLDRNGLEVIEDDAFAQLPMLRKLHLQHNKLKKVFFTLPSSLNVLDISHNNILFITTDINKINLRTLDVCGNPLYGFPPITSSKTLETLCLEGKAAVLPPNTAAKFPKLADITLVASSQAVQTELDSTTQHELSNMENVITFCIVDYYLQNLSFLMGMRNLANLKLQNITLASYEDIDNVLESLKILSNLSIDNSVHLVKPILNNALLVSRLTRLRYLSVRHTQLVTLTQQNIPENTYLDISDNPLHCDCRLSWIGHKQIDTSGKFLLSKKQTFCETPNSVEGHALLETVNMTCSDQQTSGMLEQLSDYHMWTTSTSTTTMYLSRTSTQIQMIDKMTTSSTASHNSGDSLDHSKVYIALGTILLILIAAGVALGVTLYVMKKKRTCQISPDGGETQMEQRTQTHQIKEASSKDMLIKK